MIMKLTLLLLLLTTVVDWRGLNIANSLHFSILNMLVNHVIVCHLIVEAWFQRFFVVSGVRFGRFLHFWSTHVSV